MRAISVGDAHACALTDEDRVRCWRFNIRSQVGDGTTGDRLIAVDVVGLEEPVPAISAGGSHTCAAGRDTAPAAPDDIFTYGGGGLAPPSVLARAMDKRSGRSG